MATIESLTWFSHYVQIVSAVTKVYRMYNKTDHRTRTPSDPTTVARYAHALSRSTGENYIANMINYLGLFGLPDQNNVDTLFCHSQLNEDVPARVIDGCLIVDLSKIFNVLERESIDGLIGITCVMYWTSERAFANNGNMTTRYVSDVHPEGVLGNLTSFDKVLTEYAASHS